MKILLINPNRFQSPPVPPIGLEYIASCLEAGGHNVEIADLCFSENVLKELDEAIGRFMPDITGITVRNVDSVLYHTNDFFLDEIRMIIGHLKSRHGLKVIIGGTGIMTNPEGILEYLAADLAVAGPAEGVLPELLAAIQQSHDSKKIFRGGHIASFHCARKTSAIDYKKYFDNGGIAGFETHKGCSSSCVYCIEAGSPVFFKKPEDVINEIQQIIALGFTRFHLCDSEFNEDLDFSLEFLKKLKEESLNIDWSLYMKPANQNRQLFSLLKNTGASLITLTVDSWKKCPMYWEDIEKIIFSAKSNNIKIFVDFLTGFPREAEDTLLWYLDFFRRLQPDCVNINTYLRLYKSLGITNIIMKDPDSIKKLLGDTTHGSFVKPVFYNHITAERLKELIGGDKLFRIEGIERGVNYRRASGIVSG